jgi:hypothetical protein
MKSTVTRSYEQLQPLGRKDLFERMLKVANRIARQKGSVRDQADIRAMRQICHQRHWEVCQLYCHTAIRCSVHIPEEPLTWEVVFEALEFLAKQEMQRLKGAG